MYFKQRCDVIYRDYGSFGYITDNRNFGYKTIDNNENYIGDKIVSESGAVFLSVLNRSAQSIDEIVTKIKEVFVETDTETIKADAIEFYSSLEVEGFIASGETIEECNNKEVRNFYTRDENNEYKDTDVNPQDEYATEDFFEKYYENIPRLTNLHIEIIGRCNERCLHCYIPHEKKTDIMSSSMFFDILEQCRGMKLLHLTISGGEPMAHECFVEFIKRCNEYNFSVSVLSNLTLLNQEIIDEMKRNPLLSVQTSLYSMDADIHDAITQKPGSFNKTKESILKLIANNIPLQISCPIMKQNLNSYEEVIQWGKENNINVNSDYVIIASYDHSTNNLQCRLSIDDVKKIIEYDSDNNPNYLKTIEEEKNKKKSMNADDYVCSVCHSSMCISERGNVYPCAGWQDYILGHVQETSIYDIWTKSEKANYLRNLRRRDFVKCIECAEKEFCTMCMVRNANESPEGNPLEVNQYFCDIAKINKNIFFEKCKVLGCD